MNTTNYFPFCLGAGVTAPTVTPCSREDFWRTVDSPSVKAVIEEIESARKQYLAAEISLDDWKQIKSELKRKLPIITPHVAEFERNERKNEKAIKTSRLTILDIDLEPTCERETVRKLWEDINKKKELFQLTLSHLTPSQGLRLLFERPEGMTIEEGQAWAASQLGGIRYDHSCKDLARASFLVSRDYILYIDEARLLSLPLEDVKQPSAEPAPQTLTKAAMPVKSNAIVQKWLEQNGGEPLEGSRHPTLLKMACDLLPTFGLPKREVENIFAWVINNVDGGKTPAMQRIMDALQAENSVEEEEADLVSQRFAELTPYFPDAVKVSIKGFKPDMQIIAFIVTLTSACVYADQTFTRGCNPGKGEVLYP